MLGADDDERDGDQDEPGDGMAALAAAAEGDSVTADRLRGDEKYFPDCRPALQEGQQPHHLLLLTTSGQALDVESELPEMHSPLTSSLSASTGGVAVLTATSLLAVVDGSVLEAPYGRLQGCVRHDGTIHVHGTGGVGYVLNVALSADPAEVDAAFGYLRRNVREHA